MEALRVAVYVRVRDRVKVLDAVRGALEAEGLVRGDAEDPDAVKALIAPPQGAWTPLYPDPPERARDLARAVAAKVGAPALVVGTIGDEALFYSAYDAEGEPADDYHSCPDYEKEFGDDDASDEELERTRGDVARLGALFGASVAGLGETLAAARIERLRDMDPYGARTHAEDALRALRDALSLPPLADYEEMVVDAGDGIDVRVLAFRRPRAEKGLKLPKLPAMPKLPSLRRKKDPPPAPAEKEADPEDDDEADDARSR